MCIKRQFRKRVICEGFLIYYLLRRKFRNLLDNGEQHRWSSLGRWNHEDVMMHGLDSDGVAINLGKTTNKFGDLGWDLG